MFRFLAPSCTIVCFLLVALALAHHCSADVPDPVCSTTLTAVTVKTGAPVQLPNVSCSDPTALTSYVSFTVVDLIASGNLSFEIRPYPFGTTYGVEFDFPVTEYNETDCGNGDESAWPFPITHFTPTATCSPNATGLPALCHVMYNVSVVCVPSSANHVPVRARGSWNAAQATSAVGGVAAWLAFTLMVAVGLAAME